MVASDVVEIDVDASRRGLRELVGEIATAIVEADVISELGDEALRLLRTAC
jgi:hypothetical protein